MLPDDICFIVIYELKRFFIETIELRVTGFYWLELNSRFGQLHMVKQDFFQIIAWQ